MEGFLARVRAAVELGQQSENAISYLDRNTGATVSKPQDRPGVTWSRDQTKIGAICQIVVRDTGFNMGAVLWRAVGLLFEGIGSPGGRALVVSHNV